jgi:hypothetical protein
LFSGVNGVECEKKNLRRVKSSAGTKIMRPLLVALVLCGAPLCGATRPIAERSAVLPQKVNLAQSFAKIEEPVSRHAHIPPLFPHHPLLLLADW